jgi:MoaA/NifB/PqqE/SkfB family radical SAM enzyme
MERVDLKVGYSCNNRCLHCSVESNRERAKRHGKPDLTTAQCIDQLQQGIRRGVNQVVLTGGEPTLRSDLKEILDFCQEHDLFVHFQSNGRRFSDEKVISAVRDIERVVFIIALHSPIPKQHDSTTRCPNSFNETVSGIKNLLKNGKQVIGKVVITRKNQPELVGLLRLFSELGVKRVNYSFPNIDGGMEKRFDQLIPRYSKVKEEALKVLESAETENIYVDFESLPFCIIPHYPYLVADLQYLVKIGRSIVHLDEKPHDWDRERISKKQKFSQCRGCVYDCICEGVWKRYIEAFGEKEFQPVYSIDPESFSLLLAQIDKLEYRVFSVQNADGR